MSKGNYWQDRSARRVSRRRFVSGASAAVAGTAGLSLVGCGDDDDDEPSRSPSSAPTNGGSDNTPASSPTQASEPEANADFPWSPGKDGGSLNFVKLSPQYDSLDPARSRLGSIHWGLTGNGLVEFSNWDTGALYSAICESLPEQPSETEYIFKLLPDVKWHNKAPANGRAVTMDDVVFNIERQMNQTDPLIKRGATYNAISQLERVDDKTLKVTLKSPDASWLSQMAQVFNALGHPETLNLIEKEPGVIRADLSIGTGPYMAELISNDPANNETWVRNPDYHEKKMGRPVQYLDKLTALGLSGDGNAQRIAFQQRQMDILLGRGAALDSVMQQVPEVDRRSAPDSRIWSVFYDFENPEPMRLNDPRVRRALTLAIDRKKWIDVRHGGLGRPNGNVPGALARWSLPENELLEFPGYAMEPADKQKELDEARRLWREAGADSLGPIPFLFTVQEQGQFPAIAEVIVTMMNEALDVDQFRAEPIQSADLGREQLARRTMPVFQDAGGYASADARVGLASLMHSKGGVNLWHYNNPEVDAAIEKSIRTMNVEEAVSIVYDIQRKLLNDYGGGMMSIYAGLKEQLRWPYVRNGHVFSFSNEEMAKYFWVDQSHSSWAGRPS